jgi:anti-sigma B factor antagonist
VLFDLHVTERDDGVTVVRVAGELDVATAPQLRQEAVRLIAAGRRCLVVDLTEVRFLDSTGLGVIVGVLKRARTHGGDVAVAGAADHVRKVFELTRLSDVVAMAATADEAASALIAAAVEG